nr:O-antigen ligase family protein [Pseudomonas sp. HD6421]
MVHQFLVLDRPFAYRAFRIDRSGIGDFANYGWPVAAGIFHGAVATWALGFALDKSASRKSFFFWFSIFTVLVVYVLLTYTRGAWFGLLVSGVSVIVIQNTRRGWLVLAAGVTVCIVAVSYLWHDLVFEVTTRQLSGRGPIWNYFLSQMPGYWWQGHGLGTEFKYVWPRRGMVSPHAHSLYLQQIYDSGLISLFLLLGGIVTLFYKCWSKRDLFWIRIAIPALLFALVAMLTDVERIFTRPGDYWTLFWLPVAVLLASSSLVNNAQKN